ncbi:HAD family hydrolase [Amycolatopsis sp. GM8]|uniref:HAD-IIIC family phosphatase n=1 Tax=Amycolatopsis sp. GM8 TaxID=2896530 RepID=UPI001F1BF93C|nr:HAD-IIIC family phosphatase [Amycolatopsis sp. GM8]
MTGPSAEAREKLLALHRDRLLVDRYDEAGRLLAAMTPADRARSARLLERVDTAAVADKHPRLPSVTVAVTGHGTLSALRTALTGELCAHGFLPRVRLSDFDSYVFDLGDRNSGLYAARPDVTVCVLDHSTVFDEVPVPFTPEDVAHAFERKLELWRGLVGTFRSAGTGTLVLNTIPLPRHFPAQLLDYPAKARLGAVWRAANAELLGLADAAGSIVVLDLDPLLTTGVELVEPRFEVYTSAHLSESLLTAYAGELGHLVRARSGRTKKVLALDLDQTLWGGVLGDDGVEGIEVAHGHRGEAFHGFQRVVKQLQSQGVLLAAVSKNDHDAVDGALREHPDMLLRNEDFVRVLANWRPKPDNLRELVGSLNLGADSVVFADDSAHECAAVAGDLPEVTVVELDAEPALHARKLLAQAWFSRMETTAEDRARTRLYHEETARSDFLSAAATPEDFLAGLGVSVTLGPVAAADVPRVSQLTLRTNQFNLTTERLSQADVRALAAGPAARVLTISARDRFGDNGIVGVLTLRAEEGELHIGNFLLSCRVFARGIEQACLSSVLGAARRHGYRVVRGSYRPTAKNAKVEKLYPHYGFTGGDGEYAHDLSHILDVPAHLTIEITGGLVPETRPEGAEPCA